MQSFSAPFSGLFLTCPVLDRSLLPTSGIVVQLHEIGPKIRTDISMVIGNLVLGFVFLRRALAAGDKQVHNR